MRRDFERYFTSVQLDYNKMLKQLEQVNKEISEGLVDEEQRANFELYFNRIKSNYDRLSYARYLLRLPPKFIQKIQQKSLNSKMMRELKRYEEDKADSKSIDAENKEALENIDRGIEECKNS